MKDLIFLCWRFEMIFLFEKSCFPFSNRYFWRCMNSIFAIIAVGLDAARIAFSKSKIEKTAAAVVVGIGLLVGSMADVLGQSDCDPPINDVCFHKKSGGWSSSGYATMWIDFENLPSTKSSQFYEIIWHGLKKLPGYGPDGSSGLTYDDVSHYGVPGFLDTSCSSFWWDVYSPWGGYGCTVYEGHWDWENQDDYGRPTWVRGSWVGSVHFYKYQDAAYVSLDSSLFPDFSLGQYYCSIDWEGTLPFEFHGYTEGYWEGPFPGGTYRYHGDPGSPRFHYQESCSVTILPPARTSRNTRRPTPYRP